MNSDGEIDREIRVENANLDEVAQQCEGSQAAIKATGNYYTIHDTLNEYLDVVVADPQQTKAIGVAEVKNDRLDAKLLAQLRRAGMVAQSYVPPEELRERRALVRGRETAGQEAHGLQKRRFTLYSTNMVSPTTGTRSTSKGERSSPARISHSVLLGSSS